MTVVILDILVECEGYLWLLCTTIIILQFVQTNHVMVRQASIGVIVVSSSRIPYFYISFISSMMSVCVIFYATITSVDFSYAIFMLLVLYCSSFSSS